MTFFLFLSTIVYDIYIFTTTLGHLAKPEKAKTGFRGLGLSAFLRVSEWLLVASSKQIEQECSALFQTMILIDSYSVIFV